VKGLQIIKRHFTPGETGPISVLLASYSGWESMEGQALLAHLSQGLTRLENVAEVRSLTQPLGEPLRTPVQATAPAGSQGLQCFLHKMKQGWNNVVEEQTREAARQFYLSKVAEPAPGVDWVIRPSGKVLGPVEVTRLDVVLKTDPFEPESVPTQDAIQAWLKEELPRTVRGLNGLQAESYGVTVSSRDLAVVTEADRSRINGLVLAGIFLILLVLVRKFWLAAYLLGTVLFSYYVTLGATTLMATWWSGRALGEVDWRVPFFLFTILVAVGEDYNILLITRALKERKRHGGAEGMRRALSRTGGTITSCGLIMAGTFATLMLSGLNTLVQIGFALAFGVLLDTFVVRPFLVPAFAIMVWRQEQPRREVEPTILKMRQPRRRRAA
jgi:RND superfamily putative drug exporter